MALLERVATLVRANLNDLIDKAEQPEKMIKQVILDMENQYLQVKTQVAVSIADQHMLEKKWRENEDSGKDWMRKAETAVDKSQDDLARAALPRAMPRRWRARSKSRLDFASSSFCSSFTSAPFSVSTCNFWSSTCSR